ncbi:MAG: hypothetical protein ACE5J9_10515 [Methanosarcinales archaeon]
MEISLNATRESKWIYLQVLGSLVCAETMAIPEKENIFNGIVNKFISP